MFGKYTYENPIVHSWERRTAQAGPLAKIVIGNFCSIARGCNVYLGGNHRTNWVTTYPFGHINQKIFNGVGHSYTNGDVIIGNDLWIGANVT